MRDMRDEVMAFLNDLYNAEMVRIHNQYCDEAGYADDEIFDMDMLNEMLTGKDPDEILRMAFYGDFRPCDEYFRFNGYANLESTDYPGRKGWIPVDEIADYIVENDEDFDNDDLRDLMDEIEEENEEEEEEEEEEE